MGTERWIRMALIAVSIAAGAYVLFQLRFVIGTLALAAMLTYVLLPLVEYAGRLHFGPYQLPRFGAVVLVVALATIVFVASWRAAAAPLEAEGHRLAQNFWQYRNQWATWLSGVRAALDQGLPSDFRRLLDDALTQAGALITTALGRGMRVTALWLSHLVELVLVPILAFYFMVDLPGLKQELLDFFPSRVRQPIAVAASRLDRILAAYVRGQLFLMFVSFLVVWAGLTITGVRLALILAIIAGMTRAVPIIGPVLGAIPIVAVVLLQSVQAALATLVFFIVLQVVESKVILPQIIGYALRLHAATILIALLVGNAFFGLIGMFFAPPAAAFLRDMLQLARQHGEPQ